MLLNIQDQVMFDVQNVCLGGAFRACPWIISIMLVVQEDWHDPCRVHGRSYHGTICEELSTAEYLA